MKNSSLAALFALMAPVLLAASAAAAAPALSDAQIANLDKSLLETGYEINPGAALLGALGLPPGPEPGGYGIIYRARGFTSEDKVEHGFARRSGQDDYLLTLKTKTDMEYLRADANFNLIAGADYHSGDGTPMAIDPDQAAALLKREFAAWARWADQKGAAPN